MNFTFLSPTVLNSAAVLCCAAGLGFSQDKPAPAPTKAPEVKGKAGGDPFVKKPGDKAQPSPANRTPQDIVTLQEIYAVPQGEYLRLTSEGADSTDLYREVEKLSQGGKAPLESIVALTSPSGQRAVVEQTDELSYPKAWSHPEVVDMLPVPIEWTTRPVGQQMEVEVVQSPDGRLVDLMLGSHVSKLAGFEQLAAAPGTRGLLQPSFEERELTVSVTAPNDRPQFVGTLSRPSEGEAETVRMVFLKLHPVISVPPRSLEGRPYANVRVTTSVFSMEQADAAALLRSQSEGDALYAAVVGQVAGKKARIERVLSATTKSGQRTLTREVQEYRYGTEVLPPQQELSRPMDANAHPPVMAWTGKIIPAMWTAVDMRPLGWTLEVEPVLEANTGHVSMNIVEEHVRLVGTLTGNEIAEKNDPPRPVFESQKITTSVSAAVGKPAFLGTLSPPQDTNVNGRQGPGRVWLAFVLATVD